MSDLTELVIVKNYNKGNINPRLQRHRFCSIFSWFLNMFVFVEWRDKQDSDRVIVFVEIGH